MLNRCHRCFFTRGSQIIVTSRAQPAEPCPSAPPTVGGITRLAFLILTVFGTLKERVSLPHVEAPYLAPRRRAFGTRIVTHFGTAALCCRPNSFGWVNISGLCMTGNSEGIGRVQFPVDRRYSCLATEQTHRLWNDYQSGALLIALPSILNISERNTFRVHMKFSARLSSLTLTASSRRERIGVPRAISWESPLGRLSNAIRL